MCGFIVKIRKDKKDIDSTAFSCHLESIRHRGPDAQNSIVDSHVALGHTRLSILDVSQAANQPFQNKAKTCTLVYNGEVYNYLDIKKNLPPYDYTSHSDTEVLLHAYLTHGKDALNLLDGMFAFAVYDTAKHQIFAARDRLGIKPLYIAEDSQAIYLASEIKTILAHGFQAKRNPIAIMDWVQSGYFDAEHLLFENIQMIDPGHYVEISTDSFTIKKTAYYSLIEQLKSPAILNESAAISSTQKHLDQSIKARLISDVPVGTFCSGGLDSSLVTAMAKKHHSALIAFNVSHPNQGEYDEHHYAKKVAQHVDIPLQTLRFTPQHFQENLVDTIYYNDLPLSQVNTVSLRLLSEKARQCGIKVMLTGEGADEVFGGYLGFFKPYVIQSILEKYPMGRLLFKALQSFQQKLMAPPLDMTPLPSPIDALTHHGLRNNALLNEVTPIFLKLFSSLDTKLAAELYREIFTYMQPILHRSDRATMAASIEARIPFLSHPLVEESLRLAPSLKVKTRLTGFDTKYVLKKVAENYLPKDIIYRKKVGFHTPFNYTFTQWPKPWIKDSFIAETFDLNSVTLYAWLHALSQARDEHYIKLLSLEIWGQLFIQKRNRSQINTDWLSS